MAISASWLLAPLGSSPAVCPYLHRLFLVFMVYFLSPAAPAAVASMLLHCFSGLLLAPRYLLFSPLVALFMLLVQDCHFLSASLLLTRSPMAPEFSSLYYMYWNQCFPAHHPLSPLAPDPNKSISYLACILTRDPHPLGCDSVIPHSSLFNNEGVSTALVSPLIISQSLSANFNSL